MFKFKKDKEPFLGANLDDRPESEKVKDFRFEEIVATAAGVDWVEKDWDDFPMYPIRDQNGSGSCVAQTAATLLGILEEQRGGSYVPFSATHIYQRRRNKPGSGMIGVDAMEIIQEGTTLEVFVPSDDMNDNEMDSYKIEDYEEQVGRAFKINNYVMMPTGDIDLLASTMQTTGKALMVWFFFKRDEWKREMPVVKYPDLSKFGDVARHSVTVLPNSHHLYNGKKCVIIQDSWGPHTGKEGRRRITEDFFKERNFFLVYPISFKYVEEPDVNKPSHTFTSTLNFGENNSEVVALQNILKYEGDFPANVDSTGYYGSITAKAVLAFQRRYQVANDSELDLLQGRVVGPKTIAKLNDLYGKA